MGNQSSQTNASSLREILVGLDLCEQHKVAIDWAKTNNRVIDMFGDFAKDRHLIPFQSGNESENWIDPSLSLVYKMNILVHVGGNLLKLLDRVDAYNHLFPELALKFVGLHICSANSAYPVFVQEFIDGVRFATKDEIAEYMDSRGFVPTSDTDGMYTNGDYIISDLRPKNVLRSPDGVMFVIDADVYRARVCEL